MTKTMTTADLAAELDTDARTLRKFLRSDASPVESVGKGKRYTLPATKADITKFRKAFDAWGTAQADAKKARDDAQAAPEAPADDVTETEADDSLDALEGPSDDDLDDITADLDED